MKQRIFKLRMGCWRFYLANVRLKKVSPTFTRRGPFYNDSIASAKRRRYNQNGGTCDICGKHYGFDEVQMHHILPFAEFPQYGLNPKNLEVVCEDCHHAIHLNPYANLRRMEQKAQEFGFDLQEYYNK